jgi:hypothetical protein
MFQNSAEIMSQNIRAGSEDYFELYSNSVFDMLSYTSSSPIAQIILEFHTKPKQHFIRWVSTAFGAILEQKKTLLKSNGGLISGNGQNSMHWVKVHWQGI